MSDLKQAVERLEVLAQEYGENTITGRRDRDAVATVKAALSKAEAERDLLAAECKTTRAQYAYTTLRFGDDGYSMAEAMRLARVRDAARAATDAAGVLREGK